MRFLASSFLVVAALTSFIPAKKLFTPPGTVRINDTLYFDATEITNLNWREYEYWNIGCFGRNSPEYQNALPNTLVLRDMLYYGEPYVEYYYRHPAYDSYPVIGISYEQAVEYCKWRTDRVQDRIDLNAYGREVLTKSFYYRLPTREEWEAVANAGYDEKTLKKINSKKWNDAPTCNMLPEKMQADSTFVDNWKQYGKVNWEQNFPMNVYEFPPNRLGIYNLFGNMSEMINEKGISKGGSWRDKESEATVQKDYPYKEVEGWVGLRCVCVVKW